jgi:PAS domain S-box-containing protein
VSQIQDITERKRAEDALQKTNTLLERVFANIHILIAYLDVNFDFIRVNDAYARADGRPPEFFVGKNHFDLYPHSENEAIFRQVVDTGDAYFIHAKPFEYPEHPEWDVTYWDWSLQPVKDTNGQVIELVLCLVDVTERIRAQESLQEANRLLEQTFASLDDALFVVDTTTRTIISCNPAVGRMFGYKKEEVLGRNTEFLHVGRGMYERFGRELFPALDAEGVFRTEFRMRRRDGTIFDSEHTVTEILDDSGQRTGAVSLVHDITARKQAEQELQAHREHLEELVGARTIALQKEIAERKRAEEEINSIAKFPAENPNPVMRIANDGTILYANRASTRLLEMWGCQVNQLLPDDWMTFTHDVFRSCSGDLAEVECDDRVLSLAFAPVVDPGYVNVYGFDITERKQAEKELQHAKDALEAANQELEKRVQEELQKRQAQQQLLIQRSKLESLGKLAAGIAHEINQPLAGISMGLDNISLKLSSSKATEEYLRQKIEALFQHIERIKHIIEHIRTFSREQTPLEIEPVNVNAVCRNAVSLVHTQYQNHHIAFTLNLDDTIGFVPGNSFKLEQVLLNLLTNAKDAVDAKEQGNPSAAYQKQISLITCCDDDRIYLEVSDNGVGISEEALDSIFDPFFTTKGPAHGTGLGLSVSYGIIKDMRGDIRVESQPGEYTRMTISLPRVK